MKLYYGEIYTINNYKYLPSEKHSVIEFTEFDAFEEGNIIKIKNAKLKSHNGDIWSKEKFKLFINSHMADINVEVIKLTPNDFDKTFSLELLVIE